MASPSRNASLRCTTCGGDGIVSTRDMWSADGTRDLGGCPDCVDGIRRCQVCGEGYAIGLDSNGYAVDWPCWQADRAEQRKAAGTPPSALVEAPAFLGGLNAETPHTNNAGVGGEHAKTRKTFA